MPFPTLPGRRALLLLLLCCALGGERCRANVKLPAIFGDHMVLQRDMGDKGTPVWGWADPGEAVTVTAGAVKATATTGPDGQWSVKLDKLAASATPIDVTVAGKNTVTFHDVLVGDVWVCSGQSNMEFGIKAFLSPEELQKAGDPQIRIFSVPKWVAPIPERDIAPAPEGFPLLGTWQVCTPETLSKCGEWSGFSATAYFFGHELHDATHQPLGLIASSWGGTRIHSWISLDTLQIMPEKVTAAKNAATFRDNYDQIKQTWETLTEPEWKASLAKWKEEHKAEIDAYPPAMDQWKQAAKEAAAQHVPPPPRPQAPKEPRAPRDPIHDNQSSCALYNGMIAPLMPFGIKGVIWYQGEANSAEPVVYRAEVPALVNDWRSHWGQGDFPFLIVQLPNFMARKPEPGESGWASTREAQAGALKLPNTGVAVTLDIGEAGNIHPADKLDVGRRLALLARHIAYGEEIVYTGPAYKSFAVEGGQVRIAFDNVGGGLVTGVAPEHFYAVQRPPATPPAPAAEVKGFAVAGEDHKFVWAKARIDGDTVVVGSDAVPNPAAVRYAWADNPDCNLYNREGLPAAPFRTDDWPYISPLAAAAPAPPAAPATPAP